jgi:hypothetical protein
MCTTFLKSWNWLTYTMRLVLRGLYHVQGINFHQLYQPDHRILLQGLKRYIHLHPSYLLATIMAILPTKLMNATLFPRICFVITIRNRDIMKLFVLPSSRNRSNSDYHGKICQHILLPFNQKPRHFNLPLMLFPPRVIPIRMFLKNSTTLTKGRRFKPMPLKFNICKMNSNH